MTTTDTTITTCECCGTPVRRVSDDEGTQGYGPVYLLFIGYYNAGPPIGAQNYLDMYPSRDEAMNGAAEEFVHDPNLDWAQIVTLTPDELVIVGFRKRGEPWQWQ